MYKNKTCFYIFNPQHIIIMELEPQPPQISDTNQNTITCQECGAKLTFAPGSLSLKCEYCGTVNEIKINEEARADAIKENDYMTALENLSDDQIEEVHTVKCNCCGAETTFDNNVVSANCDFCGSPIAIEQKSTAKMIKPKAILPFVVTERNSHEEFKKWINEMWFAPSALKKFANEQRISGIYLPYWTYDANTVTDYTGRRGDDYKTEEQYTDSQGQTKTRTVTHTNWRKAYGQVRNSFDDIFVVGSKSLPYRYLDNLEPWNLKDLVPYDEKFLTGFKTETYSVDLKAGFQDAQKKMQSTIDESIKKDIGGDHQEITTKSIKYNDITYKHILLPVWMSTYRFNGKAYRFIINGQSGKVSGERPYSAIKITLLILAIVAIITALVLILR